MDGCGCHWRRHPLIPLTATNTTGPLKGPVVGAGVGLVAVGTCLVWLGAKEQREAVRPRTTVHIIAGHQTSVELRRTW